MYEAPRASGRAPDLERTRPTPAGMIALVIWFLFAAVALLVAVTTVSAFSGLTKDLPSTGSLDDIAFQ